MKIRRIQNLEINRSDLDFGARLPDEIAAVNIGMQGPNEAADAPEWHSCQYQPFADFREHMGWTGRGSCAIDQPVTQFLHI